jgi:adenylosuccinate synthase
MQSAVLTTTPEQIALYDVLKGVAPIPELAYKGTATYREGPLEEVLYPIIESADVLIVAGAYFGDEGKGKTVDAIAHHKDVGVIARVNSGENAGHTVFDKEGRKYVFNLAPSGLLLEGKINLIGCECVMDPISFMEKEMKQLIANGKDYKLQLFVGNVHVVCPHHKLLDLVTSSINSSTLKGMAPIHASKVLKRGIRLDHIYNDEATLKARIKRDLEPFTGALQIRGIDNAKLVQMCKEANADGVIRIPDYVAAFAAAEDKVEYTANLLLTRVRDNPAFPTRVDATYYIRKVLSEGRKVLLEGPQSYWLSNAREKFWESSTSADTSAAGLVATSHFNFQKYRVKVLNIHKTPASSRVGIGANPCAYVPQDFFSSKGIQTLRDLPKGCCADFAAIQAKFSSCVRPNGIIEPCDYEDGTGKYSIGVAMAVASSVHHGECGSTTQKPRICGMFDCVAQFEVSSTQGPYLAISAMDRGDDYDFVSMVIAYVYYNAEGKTYDCNGTKYKNGDIIKAGMPMPTEQALFSCHPIVKLIPGWKATPIAADKRKVGDALPAGVCEFVDAVEHFTGSQVVSIGNGPKGHQIIYLKKN